MRGVGFLCLCAIAVTASGNVADQRIVGGSITDIRNYPDIACLLFAANGVNFAQSCGGTILNQRVILTAAHCFDDNRSNPALWRIRVGSTFASSGGWLHNGQQMIIHPNYNRNTFESDVALLRSASTINYVNNAVQAGFIAGANYHVADNQVVWAAGWGLTETWRPSEELRHVQVYTINQEICRQRYGASAISDNMLCSGVLNVGGRDQCTQDSGGPLYHNGVVIGICSFGTGCGDPFYPGVNARVSSFANWIFTNAN